jgi:hypothetical protein
MIGKKAPRNDRGGMVTKQVEPASIAQTEVDRSMQRMTWEMNQMNTQQRMFRPRM